MKSLLLLDVVEKILKWNEISDEEYTYSSGVIESILYNNWIKSLNWEDVFNQFLMNILERKDSYKWSLSSYEKRNYILKYIQKAYQEIIQTSFNIVDIPLYIIQKGWDYMWKVYENEPESYPADDFEDTLLHSIRLDAIKDNVTPKENYVIQRCYLDGTPKNIVAKELKIRPKDISNILKKIRGKLVFDNYKSVLI